MKGLFRKRLFPALLALALILSLIPSGGVASAAGGHFEKVTGATIEPGTYMLTISRTQGTYAWSNTDSTAGANLKAVQLSTDPSFDVSSQDPQNYIGYLYEIGFDASGYTIKGTSINIA